MKKNTVSYTYYRVNSGSDNVPEHAYQLIVMDEDEHVVLDIAESEDLLDLRDYRLEHHPYAMRVVHQRHQEVVDVHLDHGSYHGVIITKLVNDVLHESGMTYDADAPEFVGPGFVGIHDGVELVFAWNQVFEDYMKAA